MAGHKPSDLHPFGGELGDMAVEPLPRGAIRKTALSSASRATRRLVAAGYREIYLCTDDWRLPAIKTYLNLGYVPLLCTSDMDERWRLVARNLGVPFEKLEVRRVGRSGSIREREEPGQDPFRDPPDGTRGRWVRGPFPLLSPRRRT